MTRRATLDYIAAIIALALFTIACGNNSSQSLLSPSSASIEKSASLLASSCDGTSPDVVSFSKTELGSAMVTNHSKPGCGDFVFVLWHVLTNNTQVNVAQTARHFADNETFPLTLGLHVTSCGPYKVQRDVYRGALPVVGQNPFTQSDLANYKLYGDENYHDASVSACDPITPPPPPPVVPPVVPPNHNPCKTYDKQLGPLTIVAPCKPW